MEIYERTEGNHTFEVSVKDGLTEINHAQLNGKRNVKSMSQITRTDYVIEYRNGSKVTFRRTQAKPAPVEDGPTIVTVKGKRYVVGTIVPAQTDRKKIGKNSYSLPHPAYVRYWSERDGEAFGATRHANASNKSGTVGRAIWDAVSS